MQNLFVLHIKTNNSRGQNWSQRFLRRINRHTPHYLISDTQRYVKSWDEKPVRYKFYGDSNKRYKKDGKGGIITPDWSRTWSPETFHKTILTEDIRPLLKLDVPFEDVAMLDLFKLPEDDRMRQQAERTLKCDLERGVIAPYYDYQQMMMTDKSSELRKLGREVNHENMAESIHFWDAPIIKYLEQLFGCDVYFLYEYRHQDNNAPIHKLATHFHITHFNDGKKYISSDENYFNRTITFWYFGDKLLFAYADGIGSW